MKKTLLVTGALLAFAAPVFAAAEINLAWNECILDGIALQNKNGNCQVTTGSYNFVASFIPGGAMPRYIGMNAVVDIQTNSPGGALSPWWRFDLGNTSCHGTKLSSSGDFTGATGACIDAFGFAQTGSGNYVTPSPSVASPSARLKEIWGVDEALAVPIAPIGPTGGPQQYYAFKATMGNALNPGFTIATCPGCLDAACIVLNEMNLAEPAPVLPVKVTTGTQQFITWNGGPGTNVCPSATPTHKSTWGSVKALYR